MKIQSFPPLANCKSEVLLLGTMPGIQSLAMAQYYGHPRNLFWKLIATIFDEPFPTNYKQKKEMLVRINIAVWDVLQACERQGSLDSAIVEEVSNDFSVFFREHPNITLIAFNGNKSAAFFKKSMLDLIRNIFIPPYLPQVRPMPVKVLNKNWPNGN